MAAAVHKLSDSVARRDRSTVRQWVSTGLLVHEVSLLSTYGKEMGMIGDMAMALGRLNLTLRIVKSDEKKNRGDDVEEEVFRVASVTAVPRSDGNVEQTDDADAGSTASELVVGPKIVTLEVRSDEDYAWLMEQKVRISLTHDEPDAFSWLMEDRDHAIDTPEGALDIVVFPVMLTLGVNEMQTVANAAGNTGLQTDINREGLRGLQQYLEAFREYRRLEKRSSVPLSADRGGTLLRMSTSDALDGATKNNEEDETDKDLRACAEMLSSLEGLIDSEASLKQRKKVELLMQSCYAARLLNGCRTTSCKSAKDRTSMMCTLELVRLLQKRGVLEDPRSERWRRRSRMRRMSQQHLQRDRLECTEQNVLDLLRGINGVRLQNCRDNVGKAKYTFNKMQAAALPTELEPPWWTLAGARGGVKS